MNEFEYLQLCKKESNLILQKIICPYCGYVHNNEQSIEYGMSDDCEDEVIRTCKKCNKKIKVSSICTEYRFWTTKAEDKVQND